MPTLRVDAEIFREQVRFDASSTFLVVCLLDLSAMEDVIDVQISPSGQDALDLLNQLDRPNAAKVVVGVQVALPPKLGKREAWTVEPVLDFMRITVETTDGFCDTYGYHVSSGRIFADNREISHCSIKSRRSIYQASNAHSSVDPELSAFQAWIAQLLGKLIDESCSEDKGYD
ncbi:hypothetical protein [Pseudomonas sp. CJQ_11]|uniref:hypothetical protein n=1 Tax=Pseudomonas sp. CJQ_11 TaxID=3367169 RepID=UPI00370BD28E